MVAGKKTTFAEGDVVMLASGGPQMTVVAHGKKTFVVCEWFDKKGIHKSREFKRNTLVSTHIDVTDEERMQALNAIYASCGYKVTMTPIPQERG